MTTDGPSSLRDYILTPSSSDSPAHTNIGIHTHSRRPVDSNFTNTGHQNDARDTAGVSQHSRHTVKLEEQEIRLMDREMEGSFSVVTMEVWSCSASEEEEEEKSTLSLVDEGVDEEKKCHNGNNNNNNNNDSLCREVTQGET